MKKILLTLGLLVFDSLFGLILVLIYWDNTLVAALSLLLSMSCNILCQYIVRKVEKGEVSL